MTHLPAQLSLVLEETMENVFESMLFAEAFPAEDDDGDLEPSIDAALVVHIPLTSPLEGKITLAVPEDAATAWCEVVAFDEGNDPSAALMMEIANTIAGTLQSSLAGAGGVVSVGVPAVERHEHWKPGETSTNSLFETDTARVLISICGNT